MRVAHVILCFQHQHDDLFVLKAPYTSTVEPAAVIVYAMYDIFQVILLVYFVILKFADTSFDSVFIE